MEYFERLKNHPLVIVTGILAALGTLYALTSGSWWWVLALTILAVAIFLVPLFNRNRTNDFQTLVTTTETSSQLSTESLHPSGEKPAQERVLTKITCPSCKGSGNLWNYYSDVCHKCEGRSYIYTYRVGQPKCEPCKGSGRKNNYYNEDCPVCGGIGLLPYEVDDRG